MMGIEKLLWMVAIIPFIAGAQDTQDDKGKLPVSEDVRKKLSDLHLLGDADRLSDSLPRIGKLSLVHYDILATSKDRALIVAELAKYAKNQDVWIYTLNDRVDSDRKWGAELFAPEAFNTSKLFRLATEDADAKHSGPNDYRIQPNVILEKLLNAPDEKARLAILEPLKRLEANLTATAIAQASGKSSPDVAQARTDFYIDRTFLEQTAKMSAFLRDSFAVTVHCKNRQGEKVKDWEVMVARPAEHVRYLAWDWKNKPTYEPQQPDAFRNFGYAPDATRKLETGVWRIWCRRKKPNGLGYSDQACVTENIQEQTTDPGLDVYVEK